MNSDDRGAAVRWVSLGLVLVPLAVRATTPSAALPAWDLDPLLVAAPMLGYGPAGSMLMDVLAVGGAGGLLWSGGRWSGLTKVLLGLAGVGAFSVVAAGWLGHAPSIQDQRIGLAWLAAIVGAVALRHAAQDRRVYAVAGSFVLGLFVLLAAKAGVQYFVENPRTVETFRASRETFFAAQGWTAESAMARAYERRLTDPAATTWLALANVLGSFMAAGAVAFAGLAVAAGRIPEGVWGGAGRPRGLVAASLVGAAACLAGLAMAGGKGAPMAAGLGFAALAWLVLPARRPAGSARGVVARGLPLLAAAGALVAVLVRGVVGERLGELSLLFRAFYVDAAARIAMAGGALGVGPDGFKEAYLRAKVPLSPEEVSSPHSIFFDYWACLGTAGLAWVVLVLCLLWAAGRGTAAGLGAGAAARGDSGAPGGPPVRPLIRLAAGFAALATLGATVLESAGATPETALLRLGGLAAWCVVAGFLVVVFLRATAARLALGAAAVTLAAHMQIEVTATWPPSAAILFALLGLAGAPAFLDERASGGGGGSDALAGVGGAAAVSRWRRAGPGLGVLAWLAVGAGVLAPVVRWERLLLAAAADLHPVAELNDLLERSSTADSAAGRARLLGEARAHLESELARAIPDDPAALQAAAEQLRRVAIGSAMERLSRSLAIFPTFQVWRERSRLALTAARDAVETRDRETASRLLELAAAPADPPGDRLTGKGSPLAGVHVWRATAARARFELLGDRQGLADAVLHLETAAELDPYSVHHPVALAALHPLLGDAGKGAAWARRALEVNRLQRLDPGARGLSAAQEAALEAQAAAGGAGPAGGSGPVPALERGIGGSVAPGGSAGGGPGGPGGGPGGPPHGPP